MFWGVSQTNHRAVGELFVAPAPERFEQMTLGPQVGYGSYADATAKTRHSLGTPFSLCVPRSSTRVLTR